MNFVQLKLLNNYYNYFCFISVCQCVQITHLKVPATYSIEESSEDNLILDCEYELGVNETGFVLKWLYNDQSIYQWIPSHKPYALVSPLKTKLQ